MEHIHDSDLSEREAKERQKLIDICRQIVAEDGDGR
jgi:hypothetical protein